MTKLTKRPEVITVVRITDEGQVYMRTARGAMVQVALTSTEVTRLRVASDSEAQVAVLAAIIARVARPN